MDQPLASCVKVLYCDQGNQQPPAKMPPHREGPGVARQPARESREMKPHSFSCRKPQSNDKIVPTDFGNGFLKLVSEKQGTRRPISYNCFLLTVAVHNNKFVFVTIS